MNSLLPTLLLFVANQPPTLTFSTPVQGQPGSFVVIKPTQLSGKVVKYFATSPGVNIFPPGLLADKTATVITCNLPGRYTLYGFTALGDEPSDPVAIEVVIGNPGPVVPPKPVDPTKPDLPINDPLADAIQAIYGALSETDKAKNKAALAQSYRQIAQIYKDPSFVTLGQAFQRSIEISRAMLPNTALREIRARMGEEFNKDLPTDPNTVLSQNIRDLAVSRLERAAKILEAIQ